MANNQNPDNFNGIIPSVAKPEGMATQERRDVVLAFMAEHKLALKPMSVYRNLRLHRRITFKDATVQNILQELTEEGYLRRVDPKKLSDRELVDLAPDEGRGVYIVTEEGREHAQSLEF